MYHVAVFVFPALMAYAAASDLLTMKIPNWLTGTVVLTFAGAALMAGLGWSAVLVHIGTSLGVLILGVGMFALGWMGGGDAKLLAGIALWFGLSPAFLEFLTICAVAGGGLTLVLLLLRRMPLLPAFTLSWSWLHRLHDKKAGIPYGIALAIGALIAYPKSPVAQLLLRLSS